MSTPPGDQRDRTAVIWELITAQIDHVQRDVTGEQPNPWQQNYRRKLFREARERNIPVPVIPKLGLRWPLQ